MPRHFESQKIIRKLKRPKRIEEIYGLLYNEIVTETSKGRPVLVIMDSISRVHEFCKAAGLKANTIEGTNPQKDRAAIALAGKARQITIATSAAGRGMDIKLCKESIAAGGLHVIIPMLMPNQRALEQAAGRSARQGQPGSVSIYVSDEDMFRSPPQFKAGHDNLTKIELRFSEYLRSNYGWLYESQGRYSMGELFYPYGAKALEVEEITLSRLSQVCGKVKPEEEQDVFKDQMLGTVLTAWGTFFTDMCNHVDECSDIGYCDQKYQSFLKDLNVWLAPNGNTAEKALMHIKAESLKRVDWGDIAVIGGITVLATGICIVCPPATPWVVAGGAAAGAITEGGIEAYRESKTGEYDWRRILIKTLGGSLKGALASSPIKPLATAISTGAAGGIEEYLYCLACGESHEQALRSAGINGTLDGITIGGAKFIGNVVTKNWVKTKQGIKPNSIAIKEINDDTLELIKTKSAGFGSTGRQIPSNVEEQIAMKDLLKNPFKEFEGKELRQLFQIDDIRWKNWHKWQAIYRTKNGKIITIHFNYDAKNNLFDDFKFKN